MDKNQLSVDMAGFDAADINVRETEKQGEPLLFHNMVLFNRVFFSQGSNVPQQR